MQMHKQTIRIILYSSIAIMLLALVWGFRQIPMQGRQAENVLRASVDQELIVLNSAVKSSTQALKYRLLDVLKAEGGDRTTRAFQDSPFMAVSLVEWDQAQWKSLWYSVKSKTDFQAVELANWLQTWPLSKLALDEVYYGKVGDVQGQAYFVILVPVRRPNQIPMVGVGIFPANQFGLTFAADQNREIRVFDSQGHALALTHPAYLGASLKSEPLIQRMLEDEEVNLTHEWQGERGDKMLGSASKVGDSNLYVAVETPLRAAGSFALQSWIYLILCTLGAGALNWYLFSGLLKPLLIQLSQTEELNETLRRQMQGRELPLKSVAMDGEIIPLAELPAMDFEYSTPATAVELTMDQGSGSVTAPISVQKVVLASLRSLAPKIEQNQINVMHFGLEDITLDADPLQLQTALEEILKNSIEAMGDTSTRNLTISGQRSESGVSISVEDTGCGIPTDQVEKVFDPFFSTKDSQGAARGLGLNVVRRVVEELSGSVKLSSRQDETGGSTRVNIDWALSSSEIDSIPEPIELDSIADAGWPEVAIRKPKVRNLD